MNEFDFSVPSRKLDAAMFWRLYADRLDESVRDHAAKFGVDAALRFAVNNFLMLGRTPWGLSFNGQCPPAFSSDPSAARRLMETEMPGRRWSIDSDGYLQVQTEGLPVADSYRKPTPELAICEAVISHAMRSASSA